jgi:hypothetical protein
MRWDHPLLVRAVPKIRNIFQFFREYRFRKVEPVKIRNTPDRGFFLFPGEKKLKFCLFPGIPCDFPKVMMQPDRSAIPNEKFIPHESDIERLTKSWRKFPMSPSCADYLSGLRILLIPVVIPYEQPLQPL